MKQARVLGHQVQTIASSKNISITELSELIDCNESQFKSFLKGRSYVSFEQLAQIAKRLCVPISTLLAGNEDEYNKSVVHCMNDFDDSKNREVILDIIDEYMDLLDALSD